MITEIHGNPSSGAPICRIVQKAHVHGWTTEGMKSLAPGEESVVRTTILFDTTAAKTTAQRWGREKEIKIGAGVRMRWTDVSRSDDGEVGAAAVCKHRKQWRSRRGYLGTRRMLVFDVKIWTIGLVLDVMIEMWETLQQHGVQTMAVVRDSLATIRRTAHLEPGPQQSPGRWINRRAQTLLAHSITTETHSVPGHCRVPGHEEDDRQVYSARDASGSAVINGPYTLASNRARRISQGTSAAKTKWEADKCSMLFAYRLKAKAGTKTPIPMTSVKSLAARLVPSESCPP